MLDSSLAPKVDGRSAFSSTVVPVEAKPFLKWVGGKGQLIQSLDIAYPSALKQGLVQTYVEPFIGGGASFFHIAKRYPVSRYVLCDKNSDLILAYRTVQGQAGLLITVLHDLQSKYHKLSEPKREAYYYKIRDEFNAGRHQFDYISSSLHWVERTAQLIFLNKTCFNGLFRVNSEGLFNVAFGKYVNPKICDPNNLVAVSFLLQRAEIFLGDFELTSGFVGANTFVYLDPPYRPLTPTANFTSYSSDNFSALDQQRLALFYRRADAAGAKVLLSNSDPANVDPSDSFFQQTYLGSRIERISANRMINCRGDRRGKITELFIMNY